MFTLKRRFVFQLVASLGRILLNSRIFAAPDSEIVAISSTASSDDKRIKLSDNKIEFGEIKVIDDPIAK